MHALDIMKEVGRLWQSLDPVNKARFDAQAQQDKIRFKNEIEAFEAEVKNMQSTPAESPDHISKSQVTHSSKSNMGDTQHATVVKKDMDMAKSNHDEIMKRSVSQKPKRPYSAYIYFSQEVSSTQNLYDL